MDDCIIFEALGQVSSSEAGEIFRNFLRGGVRQMISEVMARWSKPCATQASACQRCLFSNWLQQRTCLDRRQNSEKKGTAKNVAPLIERKATMALTYFRQSLSFRLPSTFASTSMRMPCHILCSSCRAYSPTSNH